MAFNPQEDISRAYELYLQDDFKAAKAILDGLLEKTTGNFEVLFISGLTAYRLGEPKAGARFTEAACEVMPELRHFDHLEELQLRQGKDTADIWETQIVQFRKLKSTPNLIISYPKCGRTWVRLVLGKYVLNGIEGNPLELLEITGPLPGIPTTDLTHDDFPHWKPVDKMHLKKRMYRDNKVVFLVRDPRDVVVSYFFHYTRRGDKYRAQDPNFNGTLSDFIRYRIGGLESIIKFYNAWARERGEPRDFHLVRYEDLQGDPAGSFRGLISFLDWPDLGDQALAEAVAFGSFDNMRSLEENDAFGSFRLEAPKDGDPEAYKMRRGKIGGFKDYMTEKDILFANEFINRELDDFFDCYKA